MCCNHIQEVRWWSFRSTLFGPHSFPTSQNVATWFWSSLSVEVEGYETADSIISIRNKLLAYATQLIKVGFVVVLDMNLQILRDSNLKYC